MDSANVTILISLLRTTTSNEQIFAEECDGSSPTSVRSFCTRFLTGKDQRIDAIIFAHEYHQIGWCFLHMDKEKERNAGSLATFLITTLLLPPLLLAPVERDIRIINVVNMSGHKQSRHHLSSLQRRLDGTFYTSRNIPVSLVCIATRYVLITRRYNILQPILRIFFKFPEMAMETVLHTLFPPTPFKVPVKPTQVPDAMPEEVLKPGALYRECAVVSLQVSVSENLRYQTRKQRERGKLVDFNPVLLFSYDQAMCMPQTCLLKAKGSDRRLCNDMIPSP